MTVLNKLVEAIRGADSYNRHDLAQPRVVLWPDGERLWSRVVSVVQDAMPELLVLDSEVGPRRGPATHIRYLLARGEWKETPVVYLPGLARQAFRGAAGFPDAARHLFALQYQGQFWSQLNGRDWTPFAFLTALEGGLQLEVARDTATKEVLAEQLENVLRTPIADLTDRRLEAPDFHALTTSDPTRSLLQWMSAPEVAKEWKAAEWKSFCGIAKQQFGLDPEKDGALTAAERLAEGPNKQWNQAWRRYQEAPQAYPGVRDLLLRVKPKGLFAAHDERLPQVNRDKEAALRSALLTLGELPYKEALAKLTEQCEEHAKRAKWVWAILDEAPLATAAFHLGVMAERISAGIAGHDWDSVATAYSDQGWLTDTSAWKALASAREAIDSAAVSAALRAVYLPWLEAMAERVQKFSATYPMADPAEAWSLEPAPGHIVVFVDGLRYDLGAELRLLLKHQGFDVTLEPRWTALPTVTATAKPAWAPLAAHLGGPAISEGFEPTLVSTGKSLKAPEFRSLLIEAGWRWTEPGSLGDPQQAGWTEVGSFDRHGHDEGARLSWRIQEELKATAARVRDLLKAGWSLVTVLTDHGWLLAPGGLPKAEFPKHLTVSRWGRCAVPGPGANHNFRQTSWFWGAHHSVVLAPGICAFKAGMEYSHGGLTIQEALTPFLTVRVGKATTPAGVQVTSLKWAGLRLHVELAGDLSGLSVDLRASPADAGSSLLAAGSKARTPDEDGKVSLVVVDDDKLESPAHLVLLRADQVVGKEPVIVGGE